MEKVAGTENTGRREMSEKAAFWIPRMRFSLWRVEKVAGTENTAEMEVHMPKKIT